MNLASRSDTSSIVNATVTITEPDRAQPEDSEVEPENSRLHMLRLQILEKLVEYLPKLKNIDGIRAIPFLQVRAKLLSYVYYNISILVSRYDNVFIFCR